MIPDYLFSNADMKFSEFSFGQERIGDYAFYGAWDALGFVTGADMAERITIGEGVASLGKNAFGGCRVGELRYLANAACGAGSTGNGPFYLAQIGRLTVGEAVESIPAYLFANARFTGTQDLYLNVPVGDGAFYSGYEAGASFGELTVGENVELLGKNAFSGRNIESLVYLAEEAKTACTQIGEAPFYSCRIGKFMIGEAVTSIDAAAFSGMHVSQEELVIPDSVRKLGSYAFYGTVKDTYEPFETLRVGSGLEELAGTAFAGVSFTNVYVEALGSGKEGDAGKEPDADAGEIQGPDAGKEPDVDAGEEWDVYPGGLPSAENLFIHRGSDFYSYFSTNAAHVTLFCDDYMVSSEGERCWDEESGKYVVPHYETCSVCGYQNIFYAYEDGTEDKPEPEKKSDPEEEPDPEKTPDSEEKPLPEKEEDSGQNPEDKQEVNPEKKPDSEDKSVSEETRDPEEEPDPEKSPDPDDKQDPEKKEDSGQNPEAEKKPDSGDKLDSEEIRDPEEEPGPEKPSDSEEESDSEKKEDSGQNPEAEKTPDPEKKSDPEDKSVPEKKRDPEEESEPEKMPDPEKESGMKPEDKEGKSEPEKEPERKTDVEQNTGENPEAEKTHDPEEKPESEKREAFERNPEAKEKEMEKTEMPLKPARRPIEDTAPETDANMQDQSGQETADTDRDGSGAYEQKLYITIEAEQAG